MLLVLTAISMLALPLVVLGRWTNRISLVYNFLGQIFTKIELKYRNSGSYIYPQIVKLCLCQHWLFCLCHHSFCKGTNQVSKSWNSANFLVGKYCSAMVVAIMSTRRSIKLAPNNWLLCYRVAFSVLYTPPTNFSCSPTNPPFPTLFWVKIFFFVCLAFVLFFWFCIPTVFLWWWYLTVTFFGYTNKSNVTFVWSITQRLTVHCSVSPPMWCWKLSIKVYYGHTAILLSLFLAIVLFFVYLKSYWLMSFGNDAFCTKKKNIM